MKPTHIGYLRKEDNLYLLMFLDWFIALLGDQYESYGWNGDKWNVDVKQDQVYTFFRRLETESIMVEAPNPVSVHILRLAKQALSNVLSKNENPAHYTYWRTSFVSKTEILSGFMLHFMRGLNEHKLYQGTWKLTSEALLRFTQKVETPNTIAIDQDINVIVRVASPSYGPYAQFLASEIISRLRIVITFITGAPFNSYPHVIPTKESDRAQIVAELNDTRIPELPIGQLPFSQALSNIGTLANSEASDRLLGAMTAYEHGVRQTSESAAIIFFVTAIEALATPNTSWQTQRVTKRFQDFLLLLCADELQTFMSHLNYNAAFNDIKTPKKLVENLYNMRSKPVHTGRFQIADKGIRMMDLGDPSSIRVMLVSELTRSAIMAFIRTPLSMLTGHPQLNPLLQISLTSEEQRQVSLVAAQEKMKNTDWVHTIILKELEKRKSD